MVAVSSLPLFLAVPTLGFQITPSGPFRPAVFLSSSSPINTLDTDKVVSTEQPENDEDVSSSSVQQIIAGISGMYDDLEGINCFSQNYSPTIKFIHVSPPEQRKQHDNDFPTSYEMIAASHNATKPIAVYLPGLDGVGISASSQFDDLSSAFELWRMTIDKKNDRSSFTELTATVSNFIQDLVSIEDNREVVLIGESFGGLLAPSVALKIRAMERKHSPSVMEKEDSSSNIIKGMVLINPATSFEETQWSTLAPLLASLRYLDRERIEGEEKNTRLFPTPYSVVGGVVLSSLVPDFNQLQKIVSTFATTRIKSTKDATDLLSFAMKDGFGILENNLPAEVIEYRVGRWMTVGTQIVNPRLASLDVSTLVIAGDDDKMLPSKEEAARLIKVMPNCKSKIIKGSGHFVLDDRVNLTEAVINAPFDPLNMSSKTYDPILDWKPPSDTVIREEIEKSVKNTRTMTSPVFFSTNENGKRYLGLGQIPSNENPLLFVANHQFLGLDLGMIIAELLQERGIVARGLAHPIIFQSQSGQPNTVEGAGNDGQAGTFQTFGAVKVTPRNYYRLMETGQNALLFPGGVREVFHGKDEAYQLFWPEKVDFIRTAAKFNATIIPISAIGGADSANIIVESKDVTKLPFGIGERAANFTKNVTAARFDMDNSEELFQPPLAIPKPLAARHYFAFGKPISTKNLDHKNKEECAKYYQDVKIEVERGFADLLRAREQDPYANTVDRLIYEQIQSKKAPTFPLHILNK